jgi:predicted metal-dependent enzyme (double-stranded beta helix superfamily)
MKINAMQDFIEELSRNAENSESWMRHCASLLVHLQRPGAEIVAYLDSLSEDILQSLFDGSHDTATHYKWLIYRSARPRFTIWLHEYKDAANRGPGYAQVPHDHRYNIVSLIINGGYIATVWCLAEGKLLDGETTTYRQSDVMSLSHDKIHNLCEILPNTITLVIEGARIKPQSTSYDLATKQQRMFPDFPASWPRLKDALSTFLLHFSGLQKKYEIAHFLLAQRFLDTEP